MEDVVNIATDSPENLLDTIRGWGGDLGFQALGFTGIDLNQHSEYLDKWLKAGYHGEMAWMARHGDKRSRPEALNKREATKVASLLR